MIGKLLLSHGPLAGELLATARAIVGEVHGIRALCLDWGDGCEQAEARVAREIEALDEGDGVIILVDMYGATPCNAALAARQEGRVEVVAGMNLPMVVRVACMPSEPGSVAELATWLVEKGKASLTCTVEPKVEAGAVGGGDG